MTALPAPIPAAGAGPGDIPPVITSADVLAVLPAFLKGDDAAPVRDAMVAALTAVLLAYQASGSFAAWMSDVLHAEGTFLDGLGADRGVLRQRSEQDPSYRARIIGIPQMVTPAAIMAGINALLAPFTSVQAQYFESVLDRHYMRTVANQGSGFHSFLWKKSTTATIRAPNYPDRLYLADSAANGGAVRAQSDPGGARLFRDHVGRFLLLRIPDLSPVNNSGAFIFNTQKDSPPAGTPVYWQPTTPYSTLSIGGAKYYLPTLANQTGYWYFPTSSVSASSGSVEPMWPTVPGQFVIDGGVVWVCKGALYPIGLGKFMRTKAHGGTPLGSYLRLRGASAASVYASIASLVDRLKGAGIRVEIFVDPTLH